MEKAEDGRTLRVLIVDDHPMLRQVVVLACSEDATLEIVGEASDGEEALAKAKELAPDVIVLDLILPKIDGLEVARRLRAEKSEVNILVLTGRDDPDVVFEAVRAGVDGFLDKHSDADDISLSIRAVGEGQRLFTPEQEAKAILKLREVVEKARQNSDLADRLTPRELEVLHLIGEGLTTYQMGQRLSLSARTVESHIARTYRKLQVKTRMEALSKARRLGLLDGDDGLPHGAPARTYREPWGGTS